MWVPFHTIGLRLSAKDREVGLGSLRGIPLESFCAQDQTLQTKRNIYIYIYNNIITISPRMLVA